MSVMDSIKKSGHSTPEMPCIIEPKQYKEMIKTIRAGTHESFDKKVNELLSEGWTVKNAYIFMNGNGNGSTLYCAILSRYYETDIENGEGNQVQKHAIGKEADEHYCYDCIHNEVCRYCPHDGCDFKETLKEAAKSDTESWKHGRWLDNPNQSQLYSYICSNCRNSCDWTYRYCPNCGAKMDGDNDGKD